MSNWVFWGVWLGFLGSVIGNTVLQSSVFGTWKTGEAHYLSWVFLLAALALFQLKVKHGFYSGIASLGFLYIHEAYWYWAFIWMYHYPALLYAYPELAWLAVLPAFYLMPRFFARHLFTQLAFYAAWLLMGFPVSAGFGNVPVYFSYWQVHAIEIESWTVPLLSVVMWGAFI